MKSLHIYNTLTREKELFVPLHPPLVGLYLCGPTVYGEAHLGHARPAVTFDILHRYLKHLGYRVRYVRNITDVGHLENDADEGEDKIAKKARLEQLEPMEIAQLYTDNYHEVMEKLNVLRPSIEPRATGHIPEQIEMIEKIIQNGFAYVSEGSVYFDVDAYKKKYPYGHLSGRTELEDAISGSRENLEGQHEKRKSYDFALWKKASVEHIMRWNSPWGVGFPGWHIECSAMSTKYLGEKFDIHGGGMDLIFPHHEAEIAQTNACQCHPEPGNQANFWMHNNMITINGKKMGKSLGNFITLNQFFSGTHELLTRAFSPMTIRMFILQAHYRSTLDFSSEALEASEKALQKLFYAEKVLKKLKISGVSTLNVSEWKNKLYESLNDDLNTAKVLALFFEITSFIHSVDAGLETINEADKQLIEETFQLFLVDILGLKSDENNNQDFDEIMQLVIEIRNDARKNKNFSISDVIRDKLKAMGIVLRDGPDGTFWVQE